MTFKRIEYSNGRLIYCAYRDDECTSLFKTFDSKHNLKMWYNQYLQDQEGNRIVKNDVIEL